MNNKTKTVLISCGGTGGHILPGLSIGKEFQVNSFNVLYLLSDKPIAQKFIDNENGQFIVLPQINFEKLLSKKIFTEIYKVFKILVILFTIFFKYNIKIICSCGSGSSFIPVLLFKMFGKTGILLEQNVIMGKANRILLKFINKAYVNFPCKNINSSKIVVCGNPVTQFKPKKNSELRNLALKELNLQENKYTMLFVGGSQGSMSVNELAKRLSKDILKLKNDIQIIHLTGNNNFNELKELYDSLKIPYFLATFFNKMEYIYTVSDVAIARSGAGVLSELAFYEIPSILIPFPYAKENHQYENALFFQNEGFCTVVEEKEISLKYEEIVKNILDVKSFYNVKNYDASWNRKDAASFIVKDIINNYAY